MSKRVDGNGNEYSEDDDAAKRARMLDRVERSKKARAQQQASRIDEKMKQARRKRGQ